METSLSSFVSLFNNENHYTLLNQTANCQITVLELYITKFKFKLIQYVNCFILRIRLYGIELSISNNLWYNDEYSQTALYRAVHSFRRYTIFNSFFGDFVDRLVFHFCCGKGNKRVVFLIL